MTKSRIEKLEAGRIERNEPVLDTQLAVQLSSILKGLYQACGMAMLMPDEVKETPDLPDWAMNICTQLRLTVFKRLLELKPGNETINWRNYGRMIGILQRQFTYFGEWKKGGCAPGLESVVVPSQLKSSGNSVKNSIDSAFGQSAVIQNEFLAGMYEGYEIFLDTEGQFAGDRGRSALYFVLLARWTEIEEMRRAQPPVTCLQLYKLLAPGLGDSACRRFEWFKVFSKEIGLKMTTQGRPRKSGVKKR
jgi:hypothetical protein